MSLLRSVEKVFWVFGALLLVFYAAAQTHARLGHDQALQSFRVAEAAVAAHAIAVPGLPNPDQSLWSSQRVAAHAHSLAASLGAPAGVLRIPRLELTVPVFEGTHELVLNRGAGRIEGTAALDGHGNLGIAGHRDGYFRVLKDIAVGDAIEVKTLQGQRTFRVAETFVVDPEAVEVLEPTQQTTMTLVTCYPFYFVGHAPQRFIVRAVLDGMDSSSMQ